jgi:ribosomal protein S18 acetylase RimI-like enzyme
MIHAIDGKSLIKERAEEIASLINERNQLTRKYTARTLKAYVSNESFKFLIEADEANKLIGVIEIQKVQWYQCEIKHLSVKADQEGKGIASRLLYAALQEAKKMGASMVQCTIRNDNIASASVFSKYNFKVTNQFANKMSGNTVNVFQLSLTDKEPELKNKNAE